MSAVVLHIIEQRLRFFHVAVLRESQQLARAVKVDLLVAQLGDQLRDVFRDRCEQRGQSRGSAHDVEALGGDARERQTGEGLVEHIGQQLRLVLRDLGNRADHFVLHRTRVGHDHDNEVYLIHRDDLEPADGNLRQRRGDGDRSVIGKAGEQLACLLN